mmetsp:Transcript_17174/g.36925  ORF Transcript_17174/g.36925 Transcript_17174/m.36925 type:complete len:1182 (+) Transcript_17174:168-3713(+)
MTQPLKQSPKPATMAWCASEAAPSLLALGSSAHSAAGAFGDGASESSLDLVSFDLAKPGQNLDPVASVKTEGGRRFTSLSWGALGTDGPFPYGLLAGGLQDGIVSLWNPYKIATSQGSDPGLLHTTQVHTGSVNSVQFHPVKPNLLATCGGDGEVDILNCDNPSAPQMYKPSESAKTHQGSEVLNVAWNKKVPHILASCSNKGTTVVWDLKQKKEVISFQDPASRARCSDVSWNPEKPTQLLVAYDDDRQPSMQMWDLRNVKYPFKETQGHTKGILSVAWCASDPNLILSCGKDNRIVCWFNSSAGMELFCELHTPNTNFEVAWAPHKPSVIAASSLGGGVSLHSVQTQQTSGMKYCPSWYRKPCGVACGFGGKMLAFGRSTASASITGEKVPETSFCHSLVVPNEPEIVATADMFESWRSEKRLQEFCSQKVNISSGQADEGLMWNLLGLQFDDQGRTRLPALLGFDQERIEQEAERYLGKKPGSLMGPPPEEETTVAPSSSTKMLGPDLSDAGADDFFKNLAESTEQQRAADEAAALAAIAAAESTPVAMESSTNWSSGPESLIKQSLLVGNLTAAVECCFKSGRMAEALLLASGGGTTLWTRARDEYLRLQGDSFLTTVGNIMTNDFEKLVANSDLKNWMETLAIIATFSQDQYPALCEQLAHRLQSEAADIRSAVICYICAKNFSKTVGIWANTHVASARSNKLALQDLVEKMTVLQEVTRFNQADPLFNAKLTQYAELLANSGRLTAAMRFLTLLHDDASSTILRERIYNSAPMQMSQMFGRPPAQPWQALDVRVLYTPPAQAKAQAPHPHPAQSYQQPAQSHQQRQPMPGYPGQGVAPPAPAPPQSNSMMPPRPNYPGSAMPPAAPSMPNPYGGNMPGMPNSMGPPSSHHQPAPPPMTPTPAPPVPGGGMPPAPRMNSALPPAPKVGGCGPAPAPRPGGVAPPMPSACTPPGSMHGGMPPQPGLNQGYPGMPTAQAHAAPPQPVQPPAAPSPYAGHSPNPYGAAASSPSAAAGMMTPGKSTAPTASAAPVVDDMPVCWPLPTKTQQKGSTTRTTAEANAAIQSRSFGGSTQGDPMPENEVAHVRNVMTNLLDTVSAQENNPKKREDIAKRLEELYSKLVAGQIRNAASQKVLHLVSCLEAHDYAGANKTQTELCTIDWESNKNWLMGVKRLIPRG